MTHLTAAPAAQATLLIAHGDVAYWLVVPGVVAVMVKTTVFFFCEVV